MYSIQSSCLYLEGWTQLTIMSNEGTDIDSMTTTINTAVAETTSEILGKHRQKKKPWITAEILDLWDKKKEKRTEKEKIQTWKIWVIQGSEQHQEVNEKGKRKWLGEKCSVTEEILQSPSLKKKKKNYDVCQGSHWLFQSLLCWRWWSLNFCLHLHRSW